MVLTRTEGIDILLAGIKVVGEVLPVGLDGERGVDLLGLLAGAGDVKVELAGVAVEGQVQLFDAEGGVVETAGEAVVGEQVGGVEAADEQRPNEAGDGEPVEPHDDRNEDNNEDEDELGGLVSRRPPGSPDARDSEGIVSRTDGGWVVYGLNEGKTETKTKASTHSTLLLDE